MREWGWEKEEGKFCGRVGEKKSLYGEIERVKEDKKAFIFPDCTTDVHKL